MIVSLAAGWEKVLCQVPSRLLSTKLTVGSWYKTEEIGSVLASYVTNK